MPGTPNIVPQEEGIRHILFIASFWQALLCCQFNICTYIKTVALASVILQRLVSRPLNTYLSFSSSGIAWQSIDFNLPPNHVLRFFIVKLQILFKLIIKTMHLPCHGLLHFGERSRSRSCCCCCDKANLVGGH